MLSHTPFLSADINMVNSSDVLPSQLPNPFTPMAFLPPELAYQTAVTTYIVVGMLGVCIVFPSHFCPRLTYLFVGHRFWFGTF